MTEGLDEFQLSGWRYAACGTGEFWLVSYPACTGSCICNPTQGSALSLRGPTVMLSLPCISLQQSNTRGLIVISEDQDTRTLLIHEIQSQDIYQRQGGAHQPLHCQNIISLCEDLQHPAYVVHYILTHGFARRGNHHHLVRCRDRHRCGS